MQETKSYKSIIKGTALFGGVQVFNILINIIRGKLVAMILGPTGMGITSLLNNVLSIIQQFSSLGINYSAVRSISHANSLTDQSTLTKTITTYKTLLYITAFIGAMIIIIFSKEITTFTFGNNNYQLLVILLSIVIIFQTLTNGEQSILQGVRELKRIALASTIGPLCGLIIGVPLYFFLGINGIVPAMIVLSLISYIFVKFQTNKLKIKRENIPLKEIWNNGKGMIYLGVIFIAAALIGTTVTYLINTFIRYNGSFNDVGLYQAANSITNQYTGLIFTAMATDYYPKLSAIVNNNIERDNLVNQQLEIIILIITPIILLIILTAPLLIQILLTSEFYQVTEIIRLMGFSILFKAIVFPMGYISFAKGDKKYFFVVEGIYTNIKTLLVFVIFYNYFGLKGLGYAAVCSSLLDIIVTIILTRWRYNYKLSKTVKALFLGGCILSISCLLASYFKNIYVSYFIMTILLIISCTYSYKQLDRRIQITTTIKTKILDKLTR